VGEACPGEEESAGVNRSKRSPKGNRQLRRILNQCANAAARQKGSIFDILYVVWRLALGTTKPSAQSPIVLVRSSG
jgi:transposase